MPSKTPLKNKKFVTAVTIIITAFDLLLLYYIKYKNQQLSVSSISLNNIGNILNIIFTAVLILSILIYSVKSGRSNKPATLISYTSLMTAFLIIAIIGTEIKLPLPKIYIIDHPFEKVFIGILFTGFQFTQILFISVLWLKITGKSELLLLRAIINSSVIMAVLFVFAFVFLQLKKSEITKHGFSKSKSNVGVVLGAAVWSNNRPSPSLAGRIDKAVQLFNQGYIGKIQVTGSNAPGELSEARVALNYLESKNIPRKDIWIEEKTTSTSEQIKFIKKLLAKKKIYRVIIISDGYHLVRANEICKFFNIDTGLAASSLHLSFDTQIYYQIRESVALLVFWFFAL